MLLNKVFQDPTPEGIISQRFHKGLIEIVAFTDLTDQEKQQLFNLLILIGRKLAAVWTHYKNYQVVEDELIKQARVSPIGEKDTLVRFDYSHELYLEFDEFLVQIKSCLDYLVKLPAVPLGSKNWTIHTFSNKGKGVIKALEGSVPRQYSSWVKGATFFIQNGQPWLEDTIHARDKINHFLEGGIDFEHFAVFIRQDKDGEQLHVPMWSTDQSIRAFMEVVWHNLFCFCEDFAGCIIAFKLPTELALLHGKSSFASVESPWQVTLKADRDTVVAKGGWQKL